MDELTARFLPRFAALARDRLARGMTVAVGRQRDQGSQLVHDMHAMAGEAGLLGLSAVMELARGAESSARQFAGGEADGDAVALIDCLQRLETALKEATGT